MREAFEPVAIGHQHADRFALVGERNGKRGADCRRHLRRRLFCQHRRERKAGAFTHRRDVEAERRRRQQADISERRIAAADTGVMFEHRHTVFAEQIAQAVALTGFCRLGEPEEIVRDALLQPFGLDGGQRGDGLHQGLGGAARFRNGDEARGLVRQPREQRGERVGIEIVDEMQVRRFAQGADARHVVVGELRQRLPAERRAAGAENNDVGGVCGEAPGGVADLAQVAMGRRQMQQRQRAVGVARTQRFERALGAAKCVSQGLVGYAVLADVLLKRAVDSLGDRHGLVPT